MKYLIKSVKRLILPIVLTGALNQFSGCTHEQLEEKYRPTKISSKYLVLGVDSPYLWDINNNGKVDLLTYKDKAKHTPLLYLESEVSQEDLKKFRRSSNARTMSKETSEKLTELEKKMQEVEKLVFPASQLIDKDYGIRR